ncbi:Phosphotransferase enzyme family, partial [Aspergillus sclerotialis]
MFLYTVPPPIDLPSKYDRDGYPLILEIRERWIERQDYVESVKKAEKRKGLDCKLSTTLASHSVQNLATSVRLYKEEGK